VVEVIHGPDAALGATGERVWSARCIGRCVSYEPFFLTWWVQNKLGSQLTGAIVSTYNMRPGRAQVGIRRGEVCPSIMSWLLIAQ
jgi:hypothetical protein